MLKRIITSIFALCILIPVLCLSHTWIFPIALSIVSAMCLFEGFRCLGVHKKLHIIMPFYAVGVILPIVQRISFFDGKIVPFGATLAIICLVYSFSLVVWSHGTFTYIDMCTLALTALYIIFGINMILYIRDFDASGMFIYLLIFIGAWTTDVFAYFTGVFFGKHKLIEDVSPKKTIEGSIGGIVFCSLAFVLTGIIIDQFFEGNSNIIFLAISGACISVIAQVGDLIMSVIKRHYGIKDYGRIFPGHGGMLDRFDSILAVSLGVAAMCMVSSVIGISFI